MKKILTLIAFISILEARATEFDPTLEQKCYKEVKALGCADDKGGEEKASCVENKKTKLSQACKTFHEEKKKLKN